MTRNQQIDTLASSADSDEMPHNATFYKGLPLFAKITTMFRDTTSWFAKSGL